MGLAIETPPFPTPRQPDIPTPKPAGVLAQRNGSTAQARPPSGVLGDGLGKLPRRRNSRDQGSLRPGGGAGRARSAPAHSALSSRRAAVSRAARRFLSYLWPASPANPASLDCTLGGDVHRAREGATMPVRRVAQPLSCLFISAAWPGGAAVAMEARSRPASGLGGAGQGLALQSVR